MASQLPMRVAHLIDNFALPDGSTAPGVFFTPANTAVTEDEIVAFVRAAAKSGAHRIIPRLTDAVRADYKWGCLPSREGQLNIDPYKERCRALEIDAQVLSFFRRVYGTLLAEADRCDIGVAFHTEQPLEQLVVRADADNTMRAFMLLRREYYLNEAQHVSLGLSNTGRQAAVAVDLRDGELIDATPMIDEDGVLEWDVPNGNWCIHEFICRHDTQPNADYLSFDASAQVLERMYALFADLFEGEHGKALVGLHHSDIGFRAPNRRSWSPIFPERFAATYGFDPAPLYPHLYDASNSDTTRAKALLFACRATMLQDGICRALASFAERHALTLVTNCDEPKFSAPSVYAGDIVKNGVIAPGALMNRGYLYGINSLKIVAASAYNYGGQTVNCELFREYDELTPTILYKDTMHALMRGANHISLHVQATGGADVLTDEREKAAYFRFVTRASALLRSGEQVSDIGVIYPIHSLHATASFYEAPVRAMEYPDLPSDADYTTLINSFAFCAGQDITLLHPDALLERATVGDGVLYLPRPSGGKACFRVLVLPSARLLHPDVMRLVRRFYEAGGKVIATGEQLPTRAFVPFSRAEEADAELTANMCAVFGERALDPSVVAGHVYQHNEKGGKAYWFYPGKTAADGSMMVDSAMIRRALLDFGLPLDVVIPAMPRFAETGALGNPYPGFSVLGVHRAIPDGGTLEHIHKAGDDCHVYYFGNTTDTDFEGEILLRGEMPRLMLCDPHTGAIEPILYDRVERCGESYVRFVLRIPSVKSRFILGF